MLTRALALIFSIRRFDHIVLRHDAALVLVHFQFFIKIIVAFFVFEPAAAPAGTVSVDHVHGKFLFSYEIHYLLSSVAWKKSLSRENPVFEKLQ